MNISFSKNMGYLISIKSTHEFSKLLSEHILLKSQENNLNLCSLSPLARVTTKKGKDALVIAIERYRVQAGDLCIVAAECFQHLGEDTNLIA